ncbi:MAG: hypothetical protein HKN93_04200 [Acidimicrobiia bacterium]|nr:hypothetical protein [Acidimicrobiia bacterium]
MAALAEVDGAPRPGGVPTSSQWLMNRPVDLFFIGGIGLVGLLAATAVSLRPAIFGLILFCDVWLLGYHHVISTYTRLLFDADSRRDNLGLLTWVPVLVVVSVAAIGYGVGLWLLTSIYFYWQWWHYARQSWGVSRVYDRKAQRETPVEDPRLLQLAFYGVPLWGLLWRSSQQHDEFIGVEFRSLAVPAVVAHAVGAVACAGLAWIVYHRFVAWRAGRLPVAQTLYLASHFAMFVLGYLATSDISVGWLAMNIWHNAQYIGFVWYYNNRRFNDGVDPHAKLLSRLSQTRMLPAYMGACLIGATAVYVALDATIAVVVPAIIVYQAINFHHYIVDSVIWKVRKKPMQETLGLNVAGS